MKLKKYLSILLLGLIPVLVIGLFLFLSTISSIPQVAFHPQKEQQFPINDGDNNTLNILATTLPKFVVNMADTKFSNLWQAYAKDRDALVTPSLVSDQGNKAWAVDTQFNDKQKKLLFTPLTANQMRPGLYHLNIKIKTVAGKDITITQDFTWGVLAVNTGKARYVPGETVKIGMGVLDNVGYTKCIAKDGVVTFPTAKVWLTIVSPSGKTKNLSTDDGTIVGSPDCAPTSITNNPDFQATYVPQEIGRYVMHMTAENINGTRSIDDYFTVSAIPPAFDITRTSYPTRIYPYAAYPVTMEVVANQDYSGPVTDVVPSSFRILDISDGGTYTQASTEYSQITWQVHWQKGQTYILGYTIRFPLVSPEFYLVGPLTIGSYTEEREWQIASDAIQLVQNITPTSVTSGSTLSLTYTTQPVAGNLEIVVCGQTGNLSVTTPTRGSGSPRPNSWATAVTFNGTTPRLYSWYRVATTSDSKTVTCSYGNSSGAKSMQLYEYSGLATAGVKDHSSTHNGSCSGTPTTWATNTGTFLASNPTELAFTIFESTNPVSVNGFTSGYTQENAFNGTGSNGTYATADQFTNSISTDYTDTITLSTTGGTCTAGIVGFNTKLNYTQGSFQFFQNINNVNPTTPIGTQNQNLTLPSPHAAFRLRFLIDVDGTTTLALNNGDFNIAYATKSAGLTCTQLSYDLITQPGSQGDIAFNQQGLGSGINISSSGSDPSDATYTTTNQSYYEDDYTAPGPTGGGSPGDISNDQAALGDATAGLWDVSLIDNTDDSRANTYCLKIITGSGTNLDAYTHIAQVTLFYNEINIKGPGNSGGTTFIKGPGNSGGTTFIK